jgi:D-threo-aldose 1-dehydrogenase
MAETCRAHGVSLAAAALQFSMREPRIHSTIVGASSLDRMRESLAWASEDIPDALWAELETLVPDASEWLDATA